jgi:hypothetical protein
MSKSYQIKRREGGRREEGRRWSQKLSEEGHAGNVAWRIIFRVRVGYNNGVSEQ